MFCFTGRDKVLHYPKFSGQRTICPGCGGELVAHCGEILAWHWQHLSGKDCDPWAENPSPWHLKWQSYLKGLGASLEVYIHKEGTYHRADAVMPNGIVVELQHSGISVPEIRKREEFYENMIWVFNAIEPVEAERLDMRYNGKYYTFRWKHPRKSVAYTTCPTRLDLGDGDVLDLRRMSKDTPCGGWGYMKFIHELL